MKSESFETLKLKPNFFPSSFSCRLTLTLSHYLTPHGASHHSQLSPHAHSLSLVSSSSARQSLLSLLTTSNAPSYLLSLLLTAHSLSLLLASRCSFSQLSTRCRFSASPPLSALCSQPLSPFLCCAALPLFLLDLFSLNGFTSHVVFGALTRLINGSCLGLFVTVLAMHE